MVLSSMALRLPEEFIYVYRNMCVRKRQKKKLYFLDITCAFRNLVVLFIKKKGVNFVKIFIRKKVE